MHDYIDQKTIIDFNESTLEYYRKRIINQISHVDSYKGVRILKFPEDLRTYERIIEAVQPEVIVELGIESGGSSLWFADRLDALCGGGKVVGIDINISNLSPSVLQDERVVVVEGDLSSPNVIQRVKSLVAGKKALVIEDAAHTYECTISALKNYWDLVSVGSWLIVEDGIVDIEQLRYSLDTPRGVIRAIDDFMDTDAGKKFTRYDLAPYGITSHPTGWLFRECK